MAIRLTGFDDYYGAPGEGAAFNSADRPVSLYFDYRPEFSPSGMFMVDVGSSHGWALEDFGFSPSLNWLVTDAGGFTAYAMNGWVLPHDTWHTFTVRESNTSRQFWFNASASFEWVGSVKNPVDSGGNTTRIGSSGFRVAYGAMANVSVWHNYQLTDQDRQSLRDGAHPYTIGRGNLAHFYPMRGDGPASARTRDAVGGNHLSRVGVGTPTKHDEQPTRRRNGFVGCF